MSIGSELYTIMTGDASINSMVDYIYFERIPDNYINNITNKDTKYVFYTYKQDDLDAALGTGINKDALRRYSLFVSILGNNSDIIDQVTDRLITYLNSYASSTGVRDISFRSDDHVTDFEKNIYQNTLELNVFYES